MSFFSYEETVGRPQSRTIRGCGGCGLYKTCKDPKQGIRGEGAEGILIVGRSPGEDDTLLAEILNDNDIDIDKDCWKIGAINCEPPRGKAVTDKNVDFCRPTVSNAIRDLKPEIILLSGNEALKSVVGLDVTSKLGSIQKWRGATIPHKEYNAWICPVYHPDYVKEAAGKFRGVSELILEQDIDRILDLEPPTFSEYNIEVLTAEDEILKHLKLIKKERLTFAFDYETTGLKPHAKGHAIACVAVSYQDFHAVSFMLQSSGPVTEAFCAILKDKHIGMYAQNMKMEDRWSYHILGTKPKGWLWDSMIASHCLDNRKGVTGLKHQAYARYGIAGYDSMISPYLKPTDKSNGANSFNTVFNAPQYDLCLYCGYDAALTFQLSEDQYEEFLCLQTC